VHFRDRDEHTNLFIKKVTARARSAPLKKAVDSLEECAVSALQACELSLNIRETCRISIPSLPLIPS
jgi:hypothetical protein